MGLLLCQYSVSRVLRAVFLLQCRAMVMSHSRAVWDHGKSLLHNIYSMPLDCFSCVFILVLMSVCWYECHQRMSLVWNEMSVPFSSFQICFVCYCICDVQSHQVTEDLCRVFMGCLDSRSICTVICTWTESLFGIYGISDLSRLFFQSIFTMLSPEKNQLAMDAYAYEILNLNLAG